jgi:hypothetical protein
LAVVIFLITGMYVFIYQAKKYEHELEKKAFNHKINK